MRTINTCFLAIMLLFSLGACSPAINVYSEEEPGINLRKYRTYDWLDNILVEKDDVHSFINQQTEQKIRSTVDQRLAMYGYKQCDQDPDLKIHYHAIVKDRELFYEDWWCDDESWHKYGRCQRLQRVNYKEGTLIIDMIDTQSGNQVWRGAAIGVLENLSPEEVNKRIEKVVMEIFKKFPEQPLFGG